MRAPHVSLHTPLPPSHHMVSSLAQLQASPGKVSDVKIPKAAQDHESRKGPQTSFSTLQHGHPGAPSPLLPRGSSSVGECLLCLQEALKSTPSISMSFCLPRPLSAGWRAARVSYAWHCLLAPTACVEMSKALSLPCPEAAGHWSTLFSFPTTLRMPLKVYNGAKRSSREGGLVVPKTSSGSWTNEVGCTALPEMWDRVVKGHPLSKMGSCSTSPHHSPLYLFTHLSQVCKTWIIPGVSLPRGITTPA